MTKSTLARPRGVTASLLAAAEPEHPDAAILRAWEQWVAADQAYVADHPGDDLDGALAHAKRQQEAARAVVEQIPAHTPFGAAVKLRFALVYLDEVGDIWGPLLSGRPVDRALESDREIGVTYLLRAIADLERMAAT